MDEDRIEGFANQIKGAVKHEFGRIIGDAKLASDGTAERALGDAQAAPDPGGERLGGIDTDRILGIGHQLKGALKEGLGSIIGNDTLMADGLAERAAGKLQNTAGGLRDEARAAQASLAAPTAEPPKTPPPAAKP